MYAGRAIPGRKSPPATLRFILCVLLCRVFPRFRKRDPTTAGKGRSLPGRASKREYVSPYTYLAF